MPTEGNVYTYTREQWMGKVYSVFQDLNDSSVSFHGYARCPSLVKWPRVDTDSSVHSSAICYLLEKSCNYNCNYVSIVQNCNYGLVYLFIVVFLGRKPFFKETENGVFSSKLSNAVKWLVKKFLARIVHCPKCITTTKCKWQIVSLHIDTCLIAFIPPVWRMHLSICSFKHICFVSV